MVTMRKGTFVLVCGMIFKAAERQALDIRNHVTFHTHARFGHNNTPMLQCQAVASVFLSDFGGRSRPYISAIF